MRWLCVCWDYNLRMCMRTLCRYRLSKPSAGSVQQDLLSKLQRFDFALNDSDNGGCR